MKPPLYKKWAPQITVSVLLCLLAVMLCLTGIWAQTPTTTPPAQLPTRGLYGGGTTLIERRGWASGYYNGDLIHTWNNFDSLVGHTVSDEAAIQLDAMHGMGVNTITFELRSSSPPGTAETYPTCGINDAIGFQYPQPTATELANLPLFFNLAQSKGIKIILRLVNTHMDDRTGSQTWLHAILNDIKNHPALDSVIFDGDKKYSTDCNGVAFACGGQAEPALWLGATEYAAQYITWAISYAMSLGMPSTKLSAEAIVGDYYSDSYGPSCSGAATDGHLWPPLLIMKQVFDSLAIPSLRRTYALSWYENTKCSGAGGLPCVDASPPVWAEQTVHNVFSTIGWGSGARIIVPEMGVGVPVQPTWTSSQAIQSLARLMAKYGIDGGSYWTWVNEHPGDDSNATLSQPIKLRGTSFTYTAAKTMLAGYYTGARALPPPIPTYVLYDESTQQTQVWYLNNHVRIGTASASTIPAGWRLVAVADFNGDRHPDYLLFNPSTHQTQIWYLRGVYRIAGASAPTIPSGWTVVATGDFNGDGKPDLVLYNASTRHTLIWYLSSNVLIGTAAGPTLNAGWQLAGVADFNRDGHSDYLLFNPITRQTQIWYLSGGTYSASASGPTITSGYQLIGTADFNGDGKPDYLLYNPTTGQTLIWYLNNNAYVSAASGPTVPAGWSVVAP